MSYVPLGAIHDLSTVASGVAIDKKRDCEFIS